MNKEIIIDIENPKDNDLISRQAVLDICDLRHRYDIPYEYDEGGKHIKGYDEGRIINMTKLKQLPSAEKTGHWIEHPEIKTSTPEYLMFYECSECGDKQCFCKSDIHRKRFCNCCGCRMVEP